jgi:hypothetical protein
MTHGRNIKIFLWAHRVTSRPSIVRPFLQHHSDVYGHKGVIVRIRVGLDSILTSKSPQCSVASIIDSNANRCEPLRQQQQQQRDTAPRLGDCASR